MLVNLLIGVGVRGGLSKEVHPVILGSKIEHPAGVSIKAVLLTECPQQRPVAHSPLP